MASLPIAAGWIRQAQDHLHDAELLASAGRWQTAYLLGGHAVECALKGVLIHRLGLDRWPDRSEQPEYYTHDLAKLAGYAGVEDILPAEVRSATAVGEAWQAVKDYTLSGRYPGETQFPARLGRDMIIATGGEDGLVQWLIQFMA